MINLMENFTALQAQFADFEQKIEQLAEVMGIRLQDYEIDHIALRVNTIEKAKNWLTYFTNYGKILSDNIVNGRRIYLIELDKPIKLANRTIEVIELPFPKNKHYPVEGWEHIEIVIPFLPNETTENWVARINRQFLWGGLTQLYTKVSEPKVVGEQLRNPSIAVSFVDKTKNYSCIKVHPYSIKKILEV